MMRCPALKDTREVGRKTWSFEGPFKLTSLKPIKKTWMFVKSKNEDTSVTGSELRRSSTNHPFKYLSGVDDGG